MNKQDEAVSMLQNGFNCSQAVFSVFADTLHLDKELALKIGSGFGGGAGNGELCGAVSGALMVLGMKDGHYIQGDHERKARAYGLAKEFTDRFREAQGDIVCRTLLGNDPSKPDEHKIIAEKGLFTTECPKFVASAVDILETMLSEKNL